MTLRLMLSLAIVFALASCGVKSDLERPNMQVPKPAERDYSKPPTPLGDPGGTTPPYSTGP
jgi:predicted small lipoprotein YifL